MMISGTDLIAGPRQIIPELPYDIVFYFFFGMSRPCQKDRGGDGLCPFDSLRMIMSHLCGCLCGGTCLFHRVIQPAG